MCVSDCVWHFKRQNNFNFASPLHTCHWCLMMFGMESKIVSKGAYECLLLTDYSTCIALCHFHSHAWPQGRNHSYTWFIAKWFSFVVCPNVTGFDDMWQGATEWVSQFQMKTTCLCAQLYQINSLRIVLFFLNILKHHLHVWSRFHEYNVLWYSNCCSLRWQKVWCRHNLIRTLTSFRIILLLSSTRGMGVGSYY